MKLKNFEKTHKNPKNAQLQKFYMEKNCTSVCGKQELKIPFI